MQYVEVVAYPLQRGFVRDRSLLDNRLDLDDALIKPSISAFRSLEWRWVFRAR